MDDKQVLVDNDFAEDPSAPPVYAPPEAPPSYHACSPGNIQQSYTIPNSGQTYPGAPQQQGTYPGAPQQQGAYPGVPQQHQTYPGVPQQQQTYPGVPQQQQTYPGVPQQQQTYPGVPQQQVVIVRQQQPPPSDHTVLAVIAMFFCLPFGCVALMKASEARTLYASGNYPASQAASRCSSAWSAFSLVFGISVYLTLVLTFTLI